jgi:hypothetical protein
MINNTNRNTCLQFVNAGAQCGAMQLAWCTSVLPRFVGARVRALTAKMLDNQSVALFQVVPQNPGLK